MVTPVFSRKWFQEKQKPLLWLCNNLCTRRIMRDALYITHNKPIVQLTPFEIISYDGINFTKEIHIARAFGMRLFHNLKPVWDLFHAFDTHVANNFIPALNLQFDTLTAYPDAYPETNTVDGHIGREVGTSELWGTLRAGVGNVAYRNYEISYAFAFASNAVFDGDAKWDWLYRSIFTFSTNIGETATISDAVFSIYGSSKYDDLSCSPSLNIYDATPNANNTLQASDFSQTGGTTPTAFSSPIDYSSLNTSGYNALSLNASGKANINQTGISAFSLRNANYDADDSTPSYDSGGLVSGFSIYFADDATAANGKDPKLVITYTVPGGLTFKPRHCIC